MNLEVELSFIKLTAAGLATSMKVPEIVQNQSAVCVVDFISSYTPPQVHDARDTFHTNFTSYFISVAFSGNLRMKIKQPRPQVTPLINDDMVYIYWRTVKQVRELWQEMFIRNSFCLSFLLFIIYRKLKTST